MLFRSKYGMKVEEQSASLRSKHPYHSFISMNFLIAKNAFMKVRFDESFHLGYEDTLFGISLNQNSISVVHIDNPVYHCVVENSDQFLRKIKRAVENLIGHEDEMRTNVKLLKWHQSITKLGMQPICSFTYNHIEPLLHRNLTGGKHSLNLFAFYKLGYLCSLYQKKTQRKTSF